MHGPLLDEKGSVLFSVYGEAFVQEQRSRHLRTQRRVLLPQTSVSPPGRETVKTNRHAALEIPAEVTDTARSAHAVQRSERRPGGSGAEAQWWWGVIHLYLEGAVVSGPIKSRSTSSCRCAGLSCHVKISFMACL